MTNIQGKGKVRLIARNGRYAESAYTAALRKQVLENKLDPKVFGEVMGQGKMEGVISSKDKNGVEVADVGRGDYFVEFDNTPDVTESATANYFEDGSIRGPASIMMYMGSPSRSFTISAKLVARTPTEVTRVSNDIHKLKSWRMPESYTGGFSQKPPAILLLQGYGTMFKDIPVVMMDLSIEFSSEYDYILSGGAGGSGPESAMSDEEYNKANGPEAGSGPVSGPADSELGPVVVTAKRTRDTMVPIIVPVSITLKEVHNTGYAGQNFDGLSTFDILKYRTGELVGW